MDDNLILMELIRQSVLQAQAPVPCEAFLNLKKRPHPEERCSLCNKIEKAGCNPLQYSKDIRTTMRKHSRLWLEVYRDLSKQAKRDRSEASAYKDKLRHMSTLFKESHMSTRADKKSPKKEVEVYVFDHGAIHVSHDGADHTLRYYRVKRGGAGVLALGHGSGADVGHEGATQVVSTGRARYREERMIQRARSVRRHKDPLIRTMSCVSSWLSTPYSRRVC